MSIAGARGTGPWGSPLCSRGEPGGKLLHQDGRIGLLCAVVVAPAASATTAAPAPPTASTSARSVISWSTVVGLPRRGAVGVGAGHGGAVGDDESSGGGVRCRRRDRVFRDNELIASLDERGKGRHLGQHLLEDVKLGVEAADELVNKRSFADGVATIGERVGQSLEAMAVGRCRHITLLKVVKILFQLDGATVTVAEEEVGDPGPDAMRRDVVFVHHVEEVIRKCGVKPHEDC